MVCKDHIMNSSKDPRQPVAPKFDLPDPNLISRVTAWRLDFRQIEPGPMRTSVALREGQKLAVVDIEMSRAVHQLGEAPVGVVTFGMPWADGIEHWRGAETPRTPLIGFGAGADFDGVSRAGFRALTLSLRTDDLFEYAERIGASPPEGVLQAGVHSTLQAEDRLKIVAKRAAAFLRCPDAALPLTEDEVASELLLALTQSDAHEDRSTPRKRDRALARALDFMTEHADDCLPISEICRLSGASWRTLERAFLERFTIGPKAYYSNLRLHRARKDLLEALPATRVADVANRWGFWHMGKFAADYRTLFGDLPSADASNR
jgi:AraC-like DNA-binding protein